MKPIILAIDTATSGCSAALFIAEELHFRFQNTEREHTRLILPMIESLTLEANIPLSAVDMIAVGRGPGSFTGVRIAVSVAQGLGFALNKPIYPISTLQALAYQAHSQAGEKEMVIVPAIDARMQEIYMASFHYSKNQWESLQAEQLISPAVLSEFENQKNIIAIGSGWDAYSEAITKDIEFIPNAFPHAKDIAMIAFLQWQHGVMGVKAEQLLPVYLRNKVAEKSV